MTEETARFVLLIFDAVGGLIIFFALMTNTLMTLPKSHRIFIAIGGAGLMSQSVLTLARLNGYSTAEFWWTWAGKDICIAGIAITYAVMAIRREWAHRIS